MILVFEMVWPGTGHAVTNSATIQTIAVGFPEQTIRVFAEASHLQELRSDSTLRAQRNVSLHPIRISSRFTFRPHIVSVRRGLREFWTLCRGLRRVPADEGCLIMLISATPTAIAAAALLARLLRRRIGVQVGLHGNLNDAFGWRPRNPLSRRIDLRAALDRCEAGQVRFLVLEDAIRTRLLEQVPTAAASTDALALPISRAEAEAAQPKPLTLPVRIGLVGQATEAKGITPFLALARTFRRSEPDAVRFHLVGHPAAGMDLDAFAVLDDPQPYERLTRAAFVERLARLHYVCLPLRPEYYGLSASGALLDAITWLKPVIATRVAIVTDLFDRFGDIGMLCDDVDAMRDAIVSLIRHPDPARYERQVANLTCIRSARLPAALAARYRTIIDHGFPGLLSSTSADTSLGTSADASLGTSPDTSLGTSLNTSSGTDATLAQRAAP